MAEIKASDLQTSDELYLHREIIVDKGQKSIRIDKFLLERLENVSRSRIQNAIKVGSILVQDKNVKSNYKVRPLDKISLVLPTNPDLKERAKPQNIPINVVYEDDHVMVINKEPGMVVHPGIGNPDNTLVNALLYYFQENSGLPVMEGNSENRAGLVHRIDKDTSGLMLIAKTELAMNSLAKQFYDHSIERSYVAIVWSSPEEPEGTIEGNITRHPKDRMQMYVSDDETIGKHAVTHYKVLEDLYYVSLVQCNLETGRTHQIRVHMKYIGCTLFNDSRYGGDKVLKGTVFTKYRLFVENCFKICDRQALHAKTLGFIHPSTGEKMLFDSEIPEDMNLVLDRWRNYFTARK